MEFDSIWQQAQEFEFGRDEPSTLCPFAQRFSEWTRELCMNVIAHPDLITINQVKIRLLDRHFEWRNVLPKSHRNRVGSTGHRCVFHVFNETYEALRAVELSLTPPMLFLPPAPPEPMPVVAPPAPPPPPSIAGIFIGELDDE